MPRRRKTGTRRIERVAAASVARIALGGSGDTPVGSQERADRNADHVVDALLGRCIAGIEEERSENRGVARIQELGRCDLAVLNCQNPGGDLTLEIMTKQAINAGLQSLKAGRGILGKMAVIVDRNLAAGK